MQPHRFHKKSSLRELTNDRMVNIMTEAKPKPGDLVCVLGTDDVLIKKGSCGIIEGRVGKIEDVYSVTFNPSPMPWRTQGIVSSSGGPVRIMEAKKMKQTGEKREQKFQYWRTIKGVPLIGAGLAEVKKETVNVFEVDLTK